MRSVIDDSVAPLKSVTLAYEMGLFVVQCFISKKSIYLMYGYASPCNKDGSFPLYIDGW